MKKEKITSETITIVGDSLSMIRPENKIYFQDTYPFILHELLNYSSRFYKLANYYVVLTNAWKRNTILYQSKKARLDADILFNNSRYVILHLGIVDCAPRVVGLLGDRILSIMTQVPVLRILAELFFRFQTKYRWFFTKYFPKTYTSKKDFREKFGYIIQEIRKTNSKKIILINIADTTEKNKQKSFNFEKNILDYNGIIERLAVENIDICELIDIFSATKEHKELMLKEGIHLSKEGHRFLAEILVEKIEEWEHEIPNTASPKPLLSPNK